MPDYSSESLVPVFIECDGSLPDPNKTITIYTDVFLNQYY